MGCWNKTCGLSKLPIHSGEEVLVIPITESPYHDRCYSTALWHPVMLPFWAEYDDYGGGENSSGSLLSVFIKYAKDRLVEMDQGDNEYHDIEVKAQDFTVEKFYEAVHENRLSFTYSKMDNRSVDFMMIRKDVLDKLKARHVFTYYVGSGKGTTGYDNAYCSYTWQELLDHIPEFTCKMVEQMVVDADDATSIPALYRFNDAFRGPDDYSERNNGYHKVSAWLSLSSSTIREGGTTTVKEAIIDAATEGNTDLITEIIEDVLTARFVDFVLSSTRQIWVPGCHEGSQQDELEIYALMGDIYREAKEEKEKGEEEEEEEED